MNTTATGAPARTRRTLWGMSASTSIILGGLALAGFVYSSFMQIQTSESFLLGGGSPVQMGFSWAVMIQLIDLVTGKLTGAQGYVDSICWTVEIVTLIVGLKCEQAVEGMRKSGHIMGDLFILAALILIGWNAIGDYFYVTLPSGFFGQAFGALVTSVAVVALLPLGLMFIFDGLAEGRARSAHA